MLVKFNRRLCVLKEVTLHNEATRKVFENEVNLLWKLQHPAIVTVEAVFYDTLRAYIQMPYLAGGTLRAWVANNDPKPWEIQSVFRQLLQASRRPTTKIEINNAYEIKKKQEFEIQLSHLPLLASSITPHARRLKRTSHGVL